MSHSNPEAAGANDVSPWMGTRCCSGSIWLWLALAVAAAALAGSLILSLGMGLKACPLCFYQRTFVMSVVAVLGMGLLFGASQRVGMLALPLAAAGLGVAMFHVFLEANGTLECPPGVLGMGTAPQQSSAMFLALFLLLLIDVLKGGSVVAALVGVVIGGGLAVASSTSNPPMPAAPTQPYTAPLEICRPPFRGP